MVVWRKVFSRGGDRCSCYLPILARHQTRLERTRHPKPSILDNNRYGNVFVQLALGASMRHSHTGLSIPDFPTAYGHILPQ